MNSTDEKGCKTMRKKEMRQMNASAQTIQRISFAFFNTMRILSIENRESARTARMLLLTLTTIYIWVVRDICF